MSHIDLSFSNVKLLNFFEVVLMNINFLDNI